MKRASTIVMWTVLSPFLLFSSAVVIGTAFAGPFAIAIAAWWYFTGAFVSRHSDRWDAALLFASMGVWWWLVLGPVGEWAGRRIDEWRGIERRPRHRDNGADRLRGDGGY